MDSLDVVNIGSRGCRPSGKAGDGEWRCGGGKLVGSFIFIFASQQHCLISLNFVRDIVIRWHEHSLIYSFLSEEFKEFFTLIERQREFICLFFRNHSFEIVFKGYPLTRKPELFIGKFIKQKCTLLRSKKTYIYSSMLNHFQASSTKPILIDRPNNDTSIVTIIAFIFTVRREKHGY